jgi:hypothetical protein
MVVMYPTISILMLRYGKPQFRNRGAGLTSYIISINWVRLRIAARKLSICDTREKAPFAVVVVRTSENPSYRLEVMFKSTP